jgi:hypothetical protein
MNVYTNGAVATDMPLLPLPDPVQPLAGETCHQYVLRWRPGEDAAHWRLTLRYCHVPCDAPAVEWVDGLQRVLQSADHLVHKEPP